LRCTASYGGILECSFIPQWQTTNYKTSTIDKRVKKQWTILGQSIMFICNSTRYILIQLIRNMIVTRQSDLVKRNKKRTFCLWSILFQCEKYTAMGGAWKFVKLCIDRRVTKQWTILQPHYTKEKTKKGRLNFCEAVHCETISFKITNKPLRQNLFSV